ncbi:MAG: T9SS type A sorting domain-containing protein [Bacteroidales bacterium]
MYNINTVTKIFPILITLTFVSFCLYGQVEQKGVPLSLSSLKTSKKVDIPEYTLPDFDANAFRDKIDKLSNKKKLRFAKVFDVDLNIKENADTYKLNNGTLYLYSIRSKGAFSLFLAFDSFKIPPGAKLYVYNTDYSHIKGALTAENNRDSEVLPVAPVKGEKIIIEYFEPDNASFKGKLNVGKVGHDVVDIFNILSKGTAGVGDSDSCHVNINCPEGEEWQEVKRAITKIVTGGGYLCSGSLVNNTNFDRIPYLLTADHCIEDSSEAANSVFYFNYESPECDTSYIELDDIQSIAGAQLVSAPPESKLDFSLLKLEEDIPAHYNPYFAGWSLDTTNVKNTASIHHPMGDVKKITIDEDAPVVDNYGDTYEKNTHWRVLEWDIGTTEGGSSGSPLFNQNKRIIGDLTGGEASCDYNFNDYYAMFIYSWDYFEKDEYQLKSWLDPHNKSFNSLDGYKPYDSIPSNLRVIDEGSYISLKWDSVITNKEIEYYEIYRNNEKIGESAENFFEDVVPVKDSVYFYQVRGVFESEDFTGFSDSSGIYPVAAVSAPYVYSFEDTQSLEKGWYEQSSNHDTYWNFASGNPEPSPDGNYHYGFNAGDSVTSRLITRKIELDQSDYYLLAFDYYLDEYEGSVDELNVLIRYADSLPWKEVHQLRDSTTMWEKSRVLLPAPTEDYMIAFEGVSNGGNGVYIDNIQVFSDPDAAKFNISASSYSVCEGDSILFSIDTSDVYESYQWDMGYGAEPRYVNGYGSHWITYTASGSRRVKLVVDDKYEIIENDFIVVDTIPEPEISREGDSLISNHEEGNQWYRNDEPIPGATSQVFHFQDTGTYKVQVTNQNDCAGFSNEISVLNVGVNQPSEGKNPFKLYPNPAENSIILEFIDEEAKVQSIEYSIFDVSGRIMRNKNLTGGRKHEITLEDFEQGIYLLRVTINRGESYTETFIKQ